MSLAINQTIPHTRKTSELSRIGKEVGKTEILEKINNVKHIATITLEKMGGEGKFRLYIDDEKKEAGYLLFGLDKWQTNGLFYGGYTSEGIRRICDTEYYGNHLENNKIVMDGENLSKVYVEDLKALARDIFKGIGSILMQAAIERSFTKGSEGRIQLWSVYNSPGFYYKLGMRAELEFRENKIIDRNPMIKEELEKATAENREPDTRHLIGDMNLPLEGIQQWKKKITEHPLLTKTIKKMNCAATLIPAIKLE